MSKADETISQNNVTLKRLLNYCLGYIKLINPSLARYKIFTDPIENSILDPEFLYDDDIKEERLLFLDLKEFYTLNPKHIPEESIDKYLKQKNLAYRLEEINNKYKVNEYTKQIYLNFGYFHVEVPLDTEIEEGDESNDKNGKKSVAKSIDGFYPLFSIPIDIVFLNNKYYLKILEQNIIPNIGFLQDVLGEDRYFDFSDFISQLEIEGKLALPIHKSTISRIWEELKSRLKLSDAQFDEDSFDINRFIVSLSAKSNFFLMQDLKKLVELDDDNLIDTSLGSWVSDEGLGVEDNSAKDQGELFFPFEFDKYQVRILSILNNKAAIVQGPPGTGKSQSIANLLCHLAANNKRVLFLSQKAQALKVVKDKLKSLEIEYLYGYIPNRYSPLYNQEEEKDGASFTLTGISQYINYIHDRKNLETTKELGNVEQVKELFNESINQQRTFQYLYGQLRKLNKYEITCASEEKFLDRFSKETYKKYKEIKKELFETEDFCSDYITNNKSELRKYDEKFKHLEVDSGFSLILHPLAKEVEKKAYDRRNTIGRFFTNTFLRISTRKLTEQLPREIVEEFEFVLNQDISKREAFLKINKLKDYFYFKESLKKRDILIKEINLSLLETGLSDNGIEQIEKLIDDKTENEHEIIENIKTRIKIAQQLERQKTVDPNNVNYLLHKVKINYRDRVKRYLSNRVRSQIVQASYETSIRGIVARIAKALLKSKRAYRTFDKLKNDPTNFQTLKELIPIWIMDLEDASRLIPLEKNIFDYIILDEASQCNLAYAIPAMYRSKHVLFFGDSEQMRDDSIKFKTNRSLLELANKFDIPDHLQIKSKSDSVKSVLDIGTFRGFLQRSLLYHYRSPRELIGFSNEYFYAPKRKRMEVINSNYVTYKDTNKVLINHLLSTDRKEDVSEKTNIVEARYIAKLIKELNEDEKTKEKSIGILTFFNEQAYLLKQIIDDENVKVSIIEGIQGDEKDIIIYSFVLSEADQKKRYIPLTGESGEINKDINQGRVNVAFSRARQQVHCVTSLAPDEWPEGIWIKKYLQYVEENGSINFFDKNLKEFDSDFEKEFYFFIRNKLDKRYMIQNQVKSCGFKIDFVITDTISAKKLALECDGPTHFEDEASETYVESDVDRQSILESAGWQFYRLPYSDWIDEDYNQNEIIESINEYFNDYKKFITKFDGTKVKDNLIERNKIEESLNVLNQQNENLNTKEEVVSKKHVAHYSFKEVVRYSVDERRDLTVSLIENGKALWINEAYKTGSYVGYSNKGIGIAVEDLSKFIESSVSTIKTGKNTSLHWKGHGKSKIVIQMVNPKVIDVRHFVESSGYTGFTRRGFRLSLEKYNGFLKALYNLKI